MYIEYFDSYLFEDLMDESDNRYTKSFASDVDDFIEAKLFFEEYGFVVMKDVFSSHECQVTRDSMWNIIESSCVGFDRNDSSTWGNYKSRGKYGLSTRGPCFDEMLLKNRQNRKLITILKALIGDDDILVSQDRFTIYRATQVENGSSFATGPLNLHLDLNPWWWIESSELVEKGADTLLYECDQDFIRENNMVVKSMGTHIQCVLNFADNLTEDGGTIILPRFHKVIESWCESNQAMKMNMPWIQLPKNNPLINYARRIPMREGSVLIWNQTLFHGTSPNNSKNCRMAQFLKAFPKSCISAERLLRRSTSLSAILTEKNLVHHVDNIGEKVFGLNFCCL